MDETAVIILISGIVAIMLILSVGFVIIMIVRSTRGGSKKTSGQDTQETKLIQEIYHGLQKMEARVESLETLLLDNEGRKRDFDKELRRD